MNCPKCASPMEHKFNPFSDYEQCTNCKGLWLDANEDQKLKSIADAVDTGDAEVGKQYNEMRDVYCPQCPGSAFDRPVDKSTSPPAEPVEAKDGTLRQAQGTGGIKMLRMVDPQQPHIWFEQCPTCYGRFFDAGELKDLSEHTISDFFKKFSAVERD